MKLLQTIFVVVSLPVAGIADLAEEIAPAKPGSVIVVPDGVYRDVTWRLQATGTTEKPVTVRAQTPGKVILTGKSQVVMSGEDLVVSGLVFDQVWKADVVLFENGRHCRLTECAFIECGDPASTFAKVVHLRHESQHCRVDHCYQQGNLSMGMGVKLAADDCESTHNTFDHNYFKDIIKRSANDQEAVQIGQGSFGMERAMHALVEYCLFDNASGDAEIISNKSSCNTYRYNTFLNCRASLTLRNGNSVVVFGNVFRGCKAAVRIHAVNSFIVGNQIERCHDGILLPPGAGPALDAPHYTTPHGCVIANNIIRDCKQSAISVGRPFHSYCTNAPFANAFYNNCLRGKSDKLKQVLVEKDLIWKNDLDLDAIKLRLAAMICPGKLDEVFPVKLEVKPLTPAEVGPTWMRGDPTSIPRIPNPQPLPKPDSPKKNK